MTAGTWGQGLLWPGGLVSSDADICSHFPRSSGGRTLPKAGPVASAWTPSSNSTRTSSSLFCIIEAAHLLKCFLGPASYSAIGPGNISLSLGSFSLVTQLSHPIQSRSRSLQVIPAMLLQKYLSAALQTRYQGPLSHTTYGLAVVETQQSLPLHLCWKFLRCLTYLGVNG